MRKIKLGVLTVLILAPCVLWAQTTQCTQLSNKVGMVGLDRDDGTAYVNVSEHNNGCGCATFRFTPVNTDHQAALSVLLSARMTEKLVRVDLLDAADCNSAYRVYVQ